jgi:hypothetical protein
MISQALLSDPAENPVGRLNILGVELMSTDSQDGRHVALLYRLGDNIDDPPRRGHLRWHHLLSGEEASGRHPWVQSPLGPIRKRLIAQICDSIIRRVDENNPKVNFGFSIDFTCFGVDGRFRDMGTGNGFTCATFVLEVFRRGGIRLVRTAEWIHRPEDRAWQDRVIGELKAHGADPKHVAALEAQVSTNQVIRVRPEEVCAAAGLLPSPMSFAAGAEHGAAFLSTVLTEYRRTPAPPPSAAP